jgi:hypothetical protein
MPNIYFKWKSEISNSNLKFAVETIMVFGFFTMLYEEMFACNQMKGRGVGGGGISSRRSMTLELNIRWNSGFAKL